MLNIQNLIDDRKCFEIVRELRWPKQVSFPHCQSTWVNKRGFHNTQRYRQRYLCLQCNSQFDNLTKTVFEGHHQPLKVKNVTGERLRMTNHRFLVWYNGTDEYTIYARLEAWGYKHKIVNHSQREYARDEDVDGHHEVHVNTMEGI